MGNLLRHGVDMYKQTINMKNNPPPQDSQQESRPRKNIQKPNLPMELVKTGTDKEGENASGESKYRRVAKFLILIGSEQAAEILAELDPDQVDEISKEIALTKIIKPEERDEIMAEFHALFSKPYTFAGSSQGGIETARRILYAAKGPVKGEELLNRAIPKSKENLFSFLDDFTTEQLVLLLKNESAQTIAVILARLPAKLSAGTLSKLPSSKKPEVLKRIAHQREISPEVLEQISAALKEKARQIGSDSNDIEIDGMQTLAAILKQGDFSFGDRLINELEQEDPAIGKDLKEKLYTLDDVVNTVDRPIQDKLKTMSEHDIAVLLKGRGEAFSRKILSCVSSGRRKLIIEESEILGAIPKRDCDAVASDFLAWFRLARENGNIILYSDEDVFV